MRSRTRFRPAPTIVGALHVVGWGALLALVVPSQQSAGTHGTATVFGIGLGATAYALGLRHAFDADHIATIDNTTRRLLRDQRPATGVGLWFSLGHSTVVLALCILLMSGMRAVRGALSDDGSALHRWTETIGPAVSGVFLLAIAALNVIGLVRTRSPHAAVHGHRGGPVTALLDRFGAVVDRPARMYVVGFLFGLGFDTATEIGLLAIAGSASVSGVPWWSVLTLPVLFAAGMSLFDSVQGAMSRRAYAWSAQGKAANARRYDVLVTGVSVVAAVTIALVELAGLLGKWLPGVRGLAALGALDVSWLGLALTGCLIAAWGIGALLLRPRLVRS